MSTGTQGASPNQRHVNAVGKTADEVAAELGLTNVHPVVVVIGGAAHMPPEVLRDLTPFFDQALGPAVNKAKAVVFTGGTDAGIMSLAGRTLGRTQATLVGVSPRGAREAEQPPVALDPHHRIQVSTDGVSWGSESQMLVDLARLVAGTTSPRLVIIANGGDTSVEEVNRFLDDGWPILCITGSGGAADDLFLKISDSRRSRRDWHSVHPQAIEIYNLAGSAYGFAKRIDWRLSLDQLIKQAWISYSEFDDTAKRQQRANFRFRLLLGLGTFLFFGLIATRIQIALYRSSHPGSIFGSGHVLADVLRTVVTPIAVALPIGLAIAAALSDTIAADRGWHVMRGSAEAIKREIYRYRACSRDSAREVQRGGARLKRVIDDATRRCAQTGVLLVAQSSLNSARPPRLDEGDDEIGPLNSPDYLMHRVNDQLFYYRDRGRELRRRELRMIALSAFLGAAAGSLASTFLAPWATIFVLGSTVIAAYLERNKLRSQALQYARTAADLSQVATWWSTVPDQDKTRVKVFRSLVDQTESILEQENQQWGRIERDLAASA